MSINRVRIMKWVGYPLFAIFVFLAALYLTFPYEKVKVRVEDFLSSTGDMEVRIGTMGPSPLTGVKVENLVFRLKEKKSPRPMQTTMAKKGGGKTKKKGPKYTRVVLDEVQVSVGLLALISGGIEVSFNVEGMGGTLAGDYEKSKKKDWSLAAEAEDLKLGSMKFLSQKIGLPIKGGLSAKVKLKVPKGQINEASGVIELECDKCSVGDGKKKLKVKGHPFLASGITLPKLRLGRLSGEVKVEKGVATIKSFSAKSPDLELKLEGTVSLRKPMGFSGIDAYLRFKVSPQLKEKNPVFGLLDSALGTAKRPDGFFGMRLQGNFNSPRVLPSRIGLPKRSGISRGSADKLALAR